MMPCGVLWSLLLCNGQKNSLCQTRGMSLGFTDWWEPSQNPAILFSGLPLSPQGPRQRQDLWVSLFLGWVAPHSSGKPSELSSDSVPLSCSRCHRHWAQGFPVSFHSVLPTVSWSRSCYQHSHFIAEETEAPREVNNLPVMQLVSSSAGIWTHEVWVQSLSISFKHRLGSS